MKRFFLVVNAAVFAWSAIPGPALVGDEPVPPYFLSAERAKPLPQTLSPGKFQNTLQKRAYAAAGRLRPVLAQLPCYCWCNRGVGHRSLLDCFATSHGAG